MKDHKIMMWRVLSLVVALFAALSLTFAPVFAPDFSVAPAFAEDDDDDDDDNNNDKNCKAIAKALGVKGKNGIHTALTNALGSVAPDKAVNGGLGNNMWGTIVDNKGTVCAVTNTGGASTNQWLGSRVISAQKANTANAFSLDSGLGGTIDTLSTANLWAPVQPGGSLFGLQFSNPVDTFVAYRGNAKRYGKRNDPMVGRKIGGVNVFGGGLALYDSSGTLLGAVGVSGDTSCADHNVAWRTRDGLGLDFVPSGLSAPGADDNIIYDTTVDATTGHAASADGFGHPACGFGEVAANTTIVAACPTGDSTTDTCTAL